VVGNKRKLLIATSNQGKIAEIKEVLGEEEFEILSLADLGDINMPEENGDTFEENARIKAKAVQLAAFSALALTPLAVLADDSGLVVPVLGGAPGVFSARYAAENATDEENNEKLLRELKGKENREAYFMCSLIFINENDEELHIDGKCEGLIGHKPAGDKGFGYDPLFIPLVPLAHGNKQTMAELSPEEKNKISHRGIALQKLKAELSKPE
jgi:XTP/dITP diphosphohydrolase